MCAKCTWMSALHMEKPLIPTPGKSMKIRSHLVVTMELSLSFEYGFVFFPFYNWIIFSFYTRPKIASESPVRVVAR